MKMKKNEEREGDGERNRAPRENWEARDVVY